jgi:hypothetical protein
MVVCHVSKAHAGNTLRPDAKDSVAKLSSRGIAAALGSDMIAPRRRFADLPLRP